MGRHRWISATRTSRSASRGTTLFLWTSWVVTTLLLLLSGSLPFFQTLLLTTSRSYLQNQSLALAEAGLHEALWEINYGGGDFVNWDTDTGAVCASLGGSNCPRLVRSLTADDGSGVVVGTITVTVANPSSETPTLLTQGTITNGLSQSIRATLERPASASTFRYAAFGGSLQFRPGVGPIRVDSYAESYNPFTPLSNGHIGANNSLQFNGPQVEIHGTAYVTPATFIYEESPPIITGDPPYEYQDPEPIPPIVVPPPLLTAPDLGTLMVTSGTLRCTDLGSLDLHYSRVHVQGDATLILDEGCRLYIDYENASTDPSGPALTIEDQGTIQAEGDNQIFLPKNAFESRSRNGFVTTTQQPVDLQIYAEGFYDRSQPDPDAGIYEILVPSFIGQRAPFYGSVYERTAGLQLKQYMDPQTGLIDSEATFYGAFFTGSYFWVDNNGSSPLLNLHYDESLRVLALDGTGPLRTTITSWQTQ